MAVTDREGRQVAEIQDPVVDVHGRVHQAILATGGIAGIGEKFMTMPYHDIEFERGWNNRTVRTVDGRLVEVPWETHWKVVCRESSDSLKNLPGYRYNDRYPHGSSTGWGVYSRPAGPSTPAEATGVK